MCTICEHPSESNNIDDLLEAYERQQQKAHINKTIPVIDELSDIAYRSAFAGLLGLTIGINVLVHIIFTLAS